jgi:hypothetical protein
MPPAAATDKPWATVLVDVSDAQQPLSPSGGGTSGGIAADASYPTTPATPARASGGADADADDGVAVSSGAAGAAGAAGAPGDASPALSATAALASFVEVDAPKATALECVPYAEHHVLLWESQQLRDLGNALGRIAASEALAVVAGTTLKHTFLASLMAALAPPAYLLKACDVLDNPWAVAFNRAQKAGALLAQVLLERAHGSRPVVLVGFGLGARLLYEAALCLSEALDHGDGRAAGIVQHLVLMGLPASGEPASWTQIRKVVAGRIVNAFRPNDLVLAMVHRASNLAFDVAGLSEVQCVGVENYDVSGVVAAHHKYRMHTSDVLSLVGLEE